MFVRSLLGGRLQPTTWHLEPRAWPRRPLAAWLQPALIRAALEFLVRSGGWRRVSVVVGDQRTQARMIDAAVMAELDWRFGAASLEAVVAASRVAAGAVPGALVNEPGGTGDHVVWLLVAQGLLSSSSDASARELGVALRARSQLAPLLLPDARLPEDLDDRLVCACEGGVGLALAWLEPELVTRWLAVAEVALGGVDADLALARLQRLGALLGSYSQAALASSRPWLALAAVTTARRLLQRTGGVRRLVSRVESRGLDLFDTVAGREAFGRAVAGLLDPALDTFERVRWLQGVPWMDRREDETLLVSEVASEARGGGSGERLESQLRQARRQLAGAVG